MKYIIALLICLLSQTADASNTKCVTPYCNIKVQDNPSQVNITGALSATSLSLTGLTQNSIMFGGASGAVSQDNTNFAWNDSAKTFTVNGGLSQTLTTTFPSSGVAITNFINNTTSTTGSPTGTATVGFESQQAMTGNGSISATGGHAVGVKAVCLGSISGGNVAKCIGSEGVVDLSGQTGGTLSVAQGMQIYDYSNGNASANVTTYDHLQIINDGNWQGNAVTTYGVHLYPFTVQGAGTYGTKYSFGSDDTTAQMYNLGGLSIGTKQIAYNALEISNNVTALDNSLVANGIIVAAPDSNITAIDLDSFGSSTEYVARRYDGTNASRTALVSGDLITRFGGFGYNGSAISGAAVVIDESADGNWSTSSYPTRIVFGVTPASSTSRAQVAEFNNGGALQLAGGQAPTVSTGSITSGSTSNKGQITGLSSATSETITFNTNAPLGAVPACSVLGGTSGAVSGAYISAISTTAVTFTFSSYTGSLYYVCF